MVGSPYSPRDSQESSPIPQFKSINSLEISFLHKVHLSHPYMTTGKTIVLTRRTIVDKVMSLLFNMLSMFNLVHDTFFISEVSPFIYHTQVSCISQIVAIGMVF